MPTLREFLERGLWAIDIAEPQEVLPYDHPRYMPEPPNIARPPSAQAIKVLEATPQRRFVINIDVDQVKALSDQLESHLKLDMPVPSEVVTAHANAEASSQCLAPLHQTNCHSAVSHAYGVVNSIVADTYLRKDPGEAHLWSMWNMENDSTYLASGLAGNPTSRTGIADAACIMNRGSTYSARGLVVCKLASQLTPEERASRLVGFAKTLSSADGMQIYLSSATDQVRCWNSMVVNRQAKFWADLMTEMWEMMHIYRCDSILFTSWNRAGLLRRSGVQNITFAPVTGAGCPDTAASVNMLQALLAMALCRLQDPVGRWTDFDGGVPAKIPRPPKVPVEQTESLPPTLPVDIYGMERAQCVEAHMFQTYPDDDDALLSFLSGPDDGHVLHLGALVTNEGPVAIHRVVDTTLASGPERFVAKVVKLGNIPIHDSKSMVSRAATRARMINEANLFCGPLAHLQGTVVTRFHGLFEGYYGPDRAPLMIMLLEDVGSQVATFNSEVDKKTALRIIPLYQALFDAHVVHGDMGVHHIMLRPCDDSLRIVSFMDSWTVNPRKPREMADLLDAMRSVYREWDLDVPEHLQNIRPPWELPEDEDDEVDEVHADAEAEIPDLVNGLETTSIASSTATAPLHEHHGHPGHHLDGPDLGVGLDVGLGLGLGLGVKGFSLGSSVHGIAANGYAAEDADAAHVMYQAPTPKMGATPTLDAAALDATPKVRASARMGGSPMSPATPVMRPEVSQCLAGM